MSYNHSFISGVIIGKKTKYYEVCVERSRAIISHILFEVFLSIEMRWPGKSYLDDDRSRILTKITKYGRVFFSRAYISFNY